MSFGSKPKIPAIPDPAPTSIAPEVGRAKESFFEKLLRMKSRSRTELVSPGFLVPAETKRRGLKATMG